jgi:flagellar basal-body rod modification protein FlgD
MSTQLQGLSNSSATALVGKNVTVTGGTMTWDGSLAATANVTLAGPAQTVTATISDSNGNVVRTMSLGAQAAGPLAITWDGRNDAGLTSPAGTYTVAVSGSTASGQPVGVSQSVSGIVSSVSFSQGYPQLVLASGTVAPLSQLVSVGATPTTP